MVNAPLRRPTFEKNPRALMQLLGDIEPKISARIASNNFVCEYSAHGDMNVQTNQIEAVRSKTETFWRKHCFAVPLIKPEQASDSLGGKGKPACASHLKPPSSVDSLSSANQLRAHVVALSCILVCQVTRIITKSSALMASSLQ